METTESSQDKRIVEQLSFGAKTSKRVGWESWEFTVVGPHQVEVTNASYGFEKDDHAYIVGVAERDGLVVPAECECPADQYNEEYDCKHKVALATVGGPTVLNAAIAFENPTPASSGDDSETMASKLRADGGDCDQHEDSDCECTPEFPCADCYINGKRGFSE
jgi:hypothetical protein